MTVRTTTQRALLSLLLAVASIALAPAKIIQLPEGEAEAGEFLVGFRQDWQDPVAQAQAALVLQAQQLQVTQTFSELPGIAVVMRTEKAQAPAGEDPFKDKKSDELVAELLGRQAELKKSGLFDFVEPNYIVSLNLDSTDTGYTDGSLWGLRNTGQRGGTSGSDIRARQAWDVTTGSDQVVVAVIDSGVNYNHVDLAPNMWVNPREIAGNGIDDDNNGYVDDVHGINAAARTGDPLDDNGHGSHCAGTIGAAAGAGPVVGVAWNVKLMGLKFLQADGRGSGAAALDCVNYAVANGADIISNSWGGGPPSQAMQAAIEAANRADILFVVAAGNESNDNDRNPTYPADYEVENVISVGATDRNDRLANFSNFGTRNVDIAAPGVDIFSTWFDSPTSTETISGTSMACPHVSGVAALLKANNPNITAREMKDRLLQTARPVSGLRGRVANSGVLDAFAALTAQADGVLELQLSSNPLPLRVGAEAVISVTVNDLTPVTDATVRGSFQTQGSLTAFVDNGQNGDLRAGDAIYSARLRAPADGSVARLRLEVTAPGKTGVSETLELPMVSPPPNDRFVGRLPIPETSSRVTGTNRFATRDAGEPTNPTNAGLATVWWSWESTVTGPAKITTAGSDFDTTLAVYSGNALADLALVGANDDAVGRLSEVTFNATAGQVYQVQVAGFRTAQGAVVVNVPAAAGAPVLTQVPSPLNVPVGQTVRLAVRAEGVGPLTYQWSKDGAPLAGATALEYTKANATLNDTGSYSVEVSNRLGTTRSQPVRVTVEQIGLRPENDNFSAAVVLGEREGRLTGSNEAATGEGGEPDHANRSGTRQSVWYRFTAPTGVVGNLEFDTSGSDFDTVIAVYTGTAVNALTAVASDDDSGPGTTSAVSFGVTAGTTYHLAVDGFGSQEGKLTLNYRFLGSDGENNANDFFSRATMIENLPFAGTSDNRVASGETGELNHGGDSAPLNSMWWVIPNPETGRYQIDTRGSNFDTTLAVYQGVSLDTLALVAYDDDIVNGQVQQSELTAEVNAGLPLYIVVDGFETGTGAISLNVGFTPVTRPDNDRLEDAIEILTNTGISTGTNVGASNDPGELVPQVPSGSRIAAAPIHSVWWRFEPPTTGVMILDLTNSNFDTIVTAFEGLDYDSMTQVAFNDDNQFTNAQSSFLLVPCFAGNIYHFAVDGVGSEQGSITMSTEFVRATPDGGLDNPALDFTFGSTGNRFWIPNIAEGAPNGDKDSLYVTELPNNAESWIETQVQGPATVEFQWRVSSEATYDFLIFELDGAKQDEISGEVPWTKKSYNIPAGTHRLRWTYRKDQNTIGGSDTAWLDQLTVTGASGMARLSDLEVDDDQNGNSLGNSNGIAEPGERLELRLTVENPGFYAVRDVVVTLASSSPLIDRITDNVTRYGDIVGGQEAQSLFDFDLTLAEGMTGTAQIPLNFTIQSLEGSTTQTLMLEVQSGPDAWLGRFPSIPPAQRTPTADPDNDGVANLLEYFLGTDPTQPASSPAERGIERSFQRAVTNQHVLRFRRGKNLSGINGRVRWSMNMTTWADSGQKIGADCMELRESVIDATDPAFDVIEVVATQTAGDPSAECFFRLEVAER